MPTADELGLQKGDLVKMCVVRAIPSTLSRGGCSIGMDLEACIDYDSGPTLEVIEVRPDGSAKIKHTHHGVKEDYGLPPRTYRSGEIREIPKEYKGFKLVERANPN